MHSDPRPDQEASPPPLAALIREHLPEVHSVQDVLADGVVVFDPAGRLLYMNSAARALIGVAPQADLPGTLRELREHVELCTMSGSVLPYEDWPVTRVLDGDLSARTACRVRSSLDGGRRSYALIHAVALRDQDGDLQCVLATMHKLPIITTPLSFAPVALRHAELQPSLRSMAGALAHEVNNSLSAVQIATQFALKNPTLPAPMRGDLQDILDEVRNCVRVVNRVQGFAYAGTGRRAAHDLNDVVTATSELMQIIGRRRRIGVDCRLCSEPVPVLVSESELEQLLLAVVENAAQASEPGQRVVVSSSVDDGYAYVVVRDDGVGMPQHVRDRAFDPFFSTRYSAGAPGLGLSIAQEIVRAHGGRISLSSAPREGTTVRIRLPLHHVAAAETSEQS